MVGGRLVATPINKPGAALGSLWTPPCATTCTARTDLSWRSAVMLWRTPLTSLSVALLPALLLLQQPWPASGWVDSTHNVHAFLTFDSRANTTAIEAAASHYDYVWGADSRHLRTWRKGNSDIVLSMYIPFSRDPGCKAPAPAPAVERQGSLGPEPRATVPPNNIVRRQPTCRGGWVGVEI